MYYPDHNRIGMNTRARAARLLNGLSVRLGYCLSQEDQQRVINDSPSSVDAFTDAVVVAEGFDPVLMATGAASTGPSQGCCCVR
jgi:hypothetical protein